MVAFKNSCIGLFLSTLSISPVAARSSHHHKSLNASAYPKAQCDTTAHQPALRPYGPTCIKQRSIGDGSSHNPRFINPWGCIARSPDGKTRAPRPIRNQTRRGPDLQSNPTSPFQTPTTSAVQLTYILEHYTILTQQPRMRTETRPEPPSRHSGRLSQIRRRHRRAQNRETGSAIDEKG